MVTPRGRPIDSDKQNQQKNKLLDAAAQLMAEKSYRAITIREIAARAEINSAMVSYYFKNKEGLFIALLDRMSQLHFVNMQQVFQSSEPIRSFIQVMLKMLSDNSSIARLIHDELLAKESSLADAFIERFPKKMAQILPQIILNNTEIDCPNRAKYTAFSLISLLVTPFIGEPVRKQAWQISDDEINSPEWAEHIYSIFMSGCNYQTKLNKSVKAGKGD